MVDQQPDVDRRQLAVSGRDGQEPVGQRPRDERRAERGLAQGVGDEGRGERRVARAVDPPVNHRQLDDIAAARRDDRVDARAGEVGARDVAGA